MDWGENPWYGGKTTGKSGQSEFKSFTFLCEFRKDTIFLALVTCVNWVYKIVVMIRDNVTGETSTMQGK